MRRVTISLTDQEFEELGRRAAEDRRTPREMAAYLVVKGGQQPTYVPVPYVAPANPWTPAPWQPTWTSDRTDRVIWGPN